MRSCFPKAFETDKFLSHSNEPSSLLELTHQFLYEREIGFKLINIQLCEAKISVMRVRCGTPAKSKREFFLRIVKEWILSKTFTKSCILNVTVVLKRMNNHYEYFKNRTANVLFEETCFIVCTLSISGKGKAENTFHRCE